jgi:hypothetical protein
MRNDRASTLNEGCLVMKSIMGFEATSMMTTVTTTATYITHNWSTIPTAVMTESSEKTTSSTSTCESRAPNVGFRIFVAPSAWGFSVM